PPPQARRTGIVNLGSSYIQAEDDGGPPPVASCARLGDEDRGGRHRASDRSRGPQSDTLPGMADRPSERRRLGEPTSDLAGKAPGIPSTHARGQGGMGSVKSFSDTPQGKVDRPSKRQAAVGGGRAGRSSRPARQKVKALGCEPGRPAPPPISPSGGRCVAQFQPGYRRSSKAAEPAPPDSRTLWRLPLTVTEIVPETSYSALWNWPW